MLDALHASSIKAAVADKKNLDLDVIVHQAIDSTNSWSLQQCKQGKVLPFASFAEQQTEGRGRRGKQWEMSANSNIAMSLSWSFSLLHMQLHLLPISIAMAIVTTLEELGLAHIQVKWPNDVLVRGKKIAGILIETQPLNDKEIAVVIGVGLNYKMSSLQVRSGHGGSEVLVEITDICQEVSEQVTEHRVNRTDVAASLLKNIIEVVQNYPLQPERYLEMFRAHYDYCLEKTVELILDNQEVLIGIAQGVSDEAKLRVLVNGEQRVFNSAEVSVKT